jgi:hypothetical protein
MTELQKQCAAVGLRTWKGVPVEEMTDEACREFLDIRARQSGCKTKRK